MQLAWRAGSVEIRSGMGYETLKHTPSDRPPPAPPPKTFHTLSKYHHHLGTHCSNMRLWGNTTNKNYNSGLLAIGETQMRTPYTDKPPRREHLRYGPSGFLLTYSGPQRASPYQNMPF